METKDPFISLIEDALGRLTLKYKTEFKYEIQKTKLGISFTIFQDKEPILFKELPESNDPNGLSNLHYQILRDFIIGGIERIIMQKENEKKLFPKSHAKVSDNTIHLTNARW
jgi:hypothetical protein